MQELYSKIFRPECFELISDSKKVDPKALAEKQNKVFVQVWTLALDVFPSSIQSNKITFVQPAVEDKTKCKSDFERNSNISRFMFASVAWSWASFKSIYLLCYSIELTGW